MRIAQLGSRGIPGQMGGVERVIEAVAPRLVARGHDVTVYCADWAEERLSSYQGVQLRRVPSIRHQYFDTIGRSALATFREIASKSDVVHYHGSGSAPLALLARLFGKKVIVTVHGLDWQRRKWNAAARLFLQAGEWAAVRAPHRTIVVGEGLRQELRARYGADPQVIPNGAEARKGRAPERIGALGLKGDDYFLYLARIVPEKQPHLLIEAYGALKDRRGVKLVIAGADWHSKDYAAHVRALAAQDPDIHFLGAVDEAMLEELYANCRAYVLPSEVEGMSLSLLDGLAFGACNICSDIPANLEVIADAGLPFRGGDVGDLSAKLDIALCDQAEVQRLRQAARRRMSEDLSWDKIAGDWDALYRDVVRRC
ncbi:MAG TPA: glycosyltransferase family 4 protein [Caulobacterales bacterium]|nr:glycosyltransferase family 4 protein [Caulobacterales bacterium]